MKADISIDKKNVGSKCSRLKET